MSLLKLEFSSTSLRGRFLKYLSCRHYYIMKGNLKSCYNPLRLGTVIVLVSSGIDFVNTPRLYSDRATR